MKLSVGVEWMLHGVVLIAQAPPPSAVSRRQLAEHYDLPEAYLAKHLKALVKAGILTATSGPKGGFRLARPTSQITALDILEAVDGDAGPFVCQEMRQRGLAASTPADCRRPCAISSLMSAAHESWRASLRATTVERMLDATPSHIRQRNAEMLGPLQGKSGTFAPNAKD